MGIVRHLSLIVLKRENSRLLLVFSNTVVQTGVLSPSDNHYEPARH